MEKNKIELMTILIRYKYGDKLTTENATEEILAITTLNEEITELKGK